MQDTFEGFEDRDPSKVPSQGPSKVFKGRQPLLRETLNFFCWRLLGLIPGGAPFSQLSSGVKDAMVISTKVKCHFVTKHAKRPMETTLKRGGNKKPSTER